MKSWQVQIQREFWEHRSLWMAPLSIAAVMLLAVLLVGHVQLDLDGAGRDGETPPPLFVLMQLGWSVPFYVTAAILATVYLLDCLYGERRDRSIVFWRSLPVSDAKTVICKLLVALVMVPLGTAALEIVTSVLASGVLIVRNHGALVNGPMELWNSAQWLRVQGIMLYGLIASVLWYAPYAAYLLLVSVWAKRAPYAWAFVPPVLLALIERMLFGTHYIGSVVQRGFGELMRLAFHVNQEIAFNLGDVLMPSRGAGARMMMRPPTPTDLLLSPPLWLGLVAALAMTLLAIRLRRYRADS